MILGESGPSDFTLILVAAIAAIPLVITSWYARQAKVQATQANDAVNNIGPGETGLKDNVTNILEILEEIQTDRRHEAAMRLTRQIDVDHRMDALEEGYSSISDTINKFEPVIQQWIDTHSEINPQALEEESGG